MLVFDGSIGKKKPVVDNTRTKFQGWKELTFVIGLVDHTAFKEIPNPLPILTANLGN